MRTIERSTAFKRDFKKHGVIEAPLIEVLYRDHVLVGHRVGYRECHIKPDLLLIYQQTEDNILRLVRLG